MWLKMIVHVKWLPFGIVGVCICKGLIMVLKDAPESVIAHEQVHESEWSPLWLLKYLLSPVFRMKAEVRAYTMQAEMEYVPLVHYYYVIRDRYLLNKKAKNMLFNIVYG